MQSAEHKYYTLGHNQIQIMMLLMTKKYKLDRYWEIWGIKSSRHFFLTLLSHNFASSAFHFPPSLTLTRYNGSVLPCGGPVLRFPFYYFLWKCQIKHAQRVKLTNKGYDSTFNSICSTLLSSLTKFITKFEMSDSYESKRMTMNHCVFRLFHICMLSN